MDFDLIQYYCREKYYHTMLVIAESLLKNQPDNIVFKLQYCSALIFENRIGEALRELEILTDNQDVGLAVIIIMIYAQDLCEVPDGEQLIILENKLKIERKRASEVALYYAANFYLQINDFNKAREFMDMIFRLNCNSSKGYLIKGWLDLNDKKLTVAADSFRSVLTQNPQSFSASIGEVLSLSTDDAISRLNQLIVKHSKLTPPLIEKMKLLLKNKDWDQALDICNRIIEIDSSCIAALQFKIIYAICTRGNFDNNVEELLSVTRIQEPRNWVINYQFGTFLARLCGFNVNAIYKSIKFIEDAIKLVPDNITVNIELAHQNYLLKNYQKAIDIYKKVAQIDDSATEALIGSIKCRFMQGNRNEEIKQQIDFLLEIYNTDFNPELLLIQAEQDSVENAEKLIAQAINIKFTNAENFHFGIEFLINLDPTFIIEALKKLPPSRDSKSFKIEILQKLTNIIPGLIEAWLLLAEVYIEIDNQKDAENILKHIINNLDTSNTNANLMLAQILIKQKKYDEADSTLNLCLSQNLDVRSKPLFHFLYGKIQKQKNHFQECITSMQSALNCITNIETLKPVDLASLYLDLSSSYQIMKQTEDASDAIQKATRLLEGTSQEDQILMARTDLELWKNDPNKALMLLSTIKPDSPLYTEARTKMAEVYLKYNKDCANYIDCYKKLCEENPTQENLIKLGEAYFSVRKIVEAVEIYEKAIKKKPSPKLSKQLAELYCKCHQYGKAMRCYRDAGTEGALDLAHLLFKLEQWEMAETTLSHVPLQEKALLLSKIKEKLGDISSALNILHEAYKKINRTNDAVAVELCCKLAEYEATLHDFDSAIRHYKLALSHCEGNSDETNSIQISLSKLYLQLGDWSSCQSICSSLLSKDGNNKLALLMSADLSFRRCDFLSSGNLFHKLLLQKPNYWLALVRMIEVKRRLGVLNEVKTYLENATAAVDGNDSGLTYSKGLYHWYNNDLNEAIQYFNLVKYNPEWGQQALHNMVEINLIGFENCETANSLLQEIKPNSPDEETNRNLLVNFVLLASKDKQLIEKAMNDLTLLASRDVLRVGASLGLAIGYMHQKQPQRARNVLKIIAKTSWQFEEAEYLERCWLMLAEHYVQSGKQELAHELMKKTLTYNLSCSKAHELLGMIAEKDHKYGDPGSHYLKAWVINGHRDPNLGYRLGMFFLKSKRYADAISTCQTVFKNNSNNLKIKKDIYEKSLSLLRT